MDNLNLPQVAANQNQKEVTINDATVQLSGALADSFLVDMTAGNTTLSTANFQQYMCFTLHNDTATHNFTVPAVKRAIFLVTNNNSATTNVKVGSTTLSLAVGVTGYYQTDGTTNGLIQIGSSAGGGGGGGGGGMSSTGPIGFDGDSFDADTIPGPTGPTGPTGAAGATGATGAAGSAGASSYEWDHLHCWWSSIIISSFDGRYIFNNGSNTTNGFASVRAIPSQSTGKFYFEFLVGHVDSQAPGIGIVDSSAPFNNYVGSDTHGWATYADGNGRHGGSTTGSTTFTTGDIIGVAVDFTASTGSIKFYKNNTLILTYGSLTLGTMWPAATLIGNSTTQNDGQLALKASEQSFSQAGYSSWS